MRTALHHALRRGHVTRNVATLAVPPRIEEEEVEPYDIEEAQRLLSEAAKLRNSARWSITLALGLRQGEALGVRRSDVDLQSGILRVRKNRLRPKYLHGCGGDCGRKPGYRKQRIRKNEDTANTHYDAWKQLLTDAKVRDGRLHDARHTAATVLLIPGVPERVAMQIMGWSSTAMAALPARDGRDPGRHGAAGRRSRL